MKKKTIKKICLASMTILLLLALPMNIYAFKVLPEDYDLLDEKDKFIDEAFSLMFFELNEEDEANDRGHFYEYFIDPQEAIDAYYGRAKYLREVNLFEEYVAVVDEPDNLFPWLIYINYDQHNDINGENTTITACSVEGMVELNGSYCTFRQLFKQEFTSNEALADEAIKYIEDKYRQAVEIIKNRRRDALSFDPLSREDMVQNRLISGEFGIAGQASAEQPTAEQVESTVPQSTLPTNTEPATTISTQPGAANDVIEPTSPTEINETGTTAANLGDAATAEQAGFGGFGPVPGPETPLQGILGVVLPGVMTILAGLGGLIGGDVPPLPIDPKPQPSSAVDDQAALRKSLEQALDQATGTVVEKAGVVVDEVEQFVDEVVDEAKRQRLAEEERQRLKMEKHRRFIESLRRRMSPEEFELFQAERNRRRIERIEQKENQAAKEFRNTSTWQHFWDDVYQDSVELEEDVKEAGKELKQLGEDLTNPEIIGDTIKQTGGDLADGIEEIADSPMILVDTVVGTGEGLGKMGAAVVKGTVVIVTDFEKFKEYVKEESGYNDLKDGISKKRRLSKRLLSMGIAIYKGTTLVLDAKSKLLSAKQFAKLVKEKGLKTVVKEIAEQGVKDAKHKVERLWRRNKGKAVKAIEETANTTRKVDKILDATNDAKKTQKMVKVQDALSDTKRAKRASKLTKAEDALDDAVKLNRLEDALGEGKAAKKLTQVEDALDEGKAAKKLTQVEDALGEGKAAKKLTQVEDALDEGKAAKKLTQVEDALDEGKAAKKLTQVEDALDEGKAAKKLTQVEDALDEGKAAKKLTQVEDALDEGKAAKKLTRAEDALDDAETVAKRGNKKVKEALSGDELTEAGKEAKAASDAKKNSRRAVSGDNSDDVFKDKSKYDAGDDYGEMKMKQQKGMDLDTGYTAKENHAFQTVADSKQVKITANVSNPDGRPWREAGIAVSKPANVPFKSLNELDEYIGGPVGKRGLVANFKPKKPDIAELKKLGKSDDFIEDVIKRYNNRKRDYERYTEKLSEYIREGSMKVDSDGLISLKVVDKNGNEVFKKVASDIDLVSIKNFDGSDLTPEKYADVIEALKKRGVDLQHGASERFKFEAPDKFTNELSNTLTGNLTDENNAAKTFGPGIKPGRAKLEK